MSIDLHAIADTEDQQSSEAYDTDFGAWADTMPDEVERALFCWECDPSARESRDLQPVFDAMSSTAFTGVVVIGFRNGLPILLEGKTWPDMYEKLEDGCIRLRR
jgi:hypothetical protein